MNKIAMKQTIESPVMHSLVNSYLLQRAYTEITREQVDLVYAAILNEIPAYATLDQTNERITKSSDLYLCEDNELCARIYDEADKRLKAAGIKPQDMHHDYCPALVAEDELRKIVRVLVDTSGKPMGVSADRLLCTGMKQYDKWVDLVIGVVINSPNFKPVKL
jgi:hypothetical protein